MKQLLSTFLLVGMLAGSSAQATIVLNVIRHWSGSTGVDNNNPSYVQLYNPDAIDISLSGWTLASDDWSYTLPALTLPADCYLYVILGSGTDDSDYSDGTGTHYTGTTDALKREADELGLYIGGIDPSLLADFVCWGKGGSSFGAIYNHAVASGMWTAGAFVDVTLMSGFSNLGRIPSGYDTDTAGDWQEIENNPLRPLDPHNPMQVSPRDGLLDTNVGQFTWRPVPGATGYLLEVATDPGFTNIVFSTTVTSTSVFTVLANGAYYWRVTPQGISVSANKRAVWKVTKGAPDIHETNTTSVPQRYQHKDSPILCIYDCENNARGGCTEFAGAAGPWDAEHSQGDHIKQCPHCRNYCARASIQMVNARFGGSLTQDEISYHGNWADLSAAKPEGDLGHGWGMWPQAQNTYSWAMNGASIDSVSNVGGADSSISLGTVASDIDNGLPILAVRDNGGGGLHAFVINGYTTAYGDHKLLITDPWPGLSGWWDWDRLRITCFYRLQGTPTGRATDSKVQSDEDGDGVKDFDEGQQTTQQTPRTFCCNYQMKDTEGDEVDDREEIRAYTFHDMDDGHDNDDIWYSDIDHDGKRTECDCDSDDDSDFDGGEDINGDGHNPVGGLETCEFEGPGEIWISVFALWGGWLCTEDIYAFGQTYHNYSTYPAELLLGCPGHSDGDPLSNSISLFAGQDGIIQPQYIGSFGPGLYQLTVDVLKDALYSAPDNWDPLVCFMIPPHILIVPPPPYPTPIPPPPYPTPVPTGDYGTALTQLGKQYVIYDYPWGGPGPSLEDLLNYPVVIWCTGALRNPYILSPTDAINLMQYIDMGGKVFFTGAEIGQEVFLTADPAQMSLYADYMGAGYGGENAGCTSVFGWPDSFFDVYSEIEIPINRYNEIYWDYQSPDAVWPVSPDAQSLLGYNWYPECPEGAHACLAMERPDGGGRVVYMSFPWESIADDVIRTEMLDMILQWLYGEHLPPPAPSEAVLYLDGENLVLDWMESAGTINYQIHAADEPDFDPNESTLAGIAELPPFVIPGGTGDHEKQFFKVVAVGSDMQGGHELHEWIQQQCDPEVVKQRLDAEQVHYRFFTSQQ